MRVAVLASMRERETRRIVETAGCAMDYFRNERERLKRAWPKFLQKQQIGEVFEILFVRDCKYGSEAFQIDISRMDLVMRGHLQMPRFRKCFVRTFVGDFEHRGLSTSGIRVNQIHDRSLILTDDRCVRFSNKVSHRS